MTIASPEPTTRKIRPQPGPQEQFSACPADICFYGGSAGGGKTWALAYEAARYVTVPGYSAVIFRRNTTQLTGGGSIWEETKKLYPHVGGEAREHPLLDYRFPSSALVEFRHLQHANTVYDHQGKQYDFIGFDEVTHFEAFQFWYMLSRLRSGGSGVPKRVRATCNPDPDSFVRGLIDWWIDKDGKAIPERSGVIRWMARIDEQLLWADSADELWAMRPDRIRRRGAPPQDENDQRPEPISFTFIRARAQDNKILMRNDPGYLSRLALIPGAESKRLLDGDWNAKDSAGDYFSRTTFGFDDHPPPKINVRRRVRFWDKAATSPSSANPDPDWTVGTRVAELDTGDWVIEDVIDCREGPAGVEIRVKATAELDGRECIVGFWQDPGQAGKVDIHSMEKLLRGWPVVSVVASKDKTVYAKVWAPKAKAGGIRVVRAPWNARFFSVLEAFPDPKAHDDHVDSMSGAAQVLTGGGTWATGDGYEAAPDSRHPLDNVTPSRARMRPGEDDDHGGMRHGGGY